MALCDDEIGTTWRSDTTTPAEAEWLSFGERELFESGQRALERCVGDVKQFFADHWERSPRLTGGSGYEDLLDLDGVDQLLSTHSFCPPQLELVRDGQILAHDSFVRTERPVGFSPQKVAEPRRVLGAIDRGWTLVLNNLDSRVSALLDLCVALSTRLSHRVEATAFLTPPGSTAFERHWDAKEILTLQISGTKRWVVEEPLLELPLRTQRSFENMPRSRIVFDADLVPGDCLYVPRGFIHSVSAGSGASLSLSLGISPATALSAVEAELGAAGKQVKVLRESIPPGFATPLRGAEHDEPFAELIGRLRFDGRSVLARARERFWTALPSSPRGRLVALLSAEDVDPRSFVRRTPGLVVRTGTVDGRLLVRAGDLELSIPAGVGHLVGLLLEGSSITAAAEASSVDLADGVVVARRLIREGLLRPTPASGRPSGCR